MPKMQTDRLLLLSLVKFVRSELTTEGYTGVTVIDRFPKDVDKIVVSSTGDPDEIVAPVVAIDLRRSVEGKSAGLGMTEYEHIAKVAVFVYALSFGQELDLRTFLAKRFRKGEVKMYDFSVNGFPGDGSEPELSPVLATEVVHVPDHMPMHSNEALRYVGVIAVTFRVFAE